MCAAASAAEPASQADFPLRAESYAALEADLREEGWTAALKSRGFDSAVPTVWIAEVKLNATH